MADITVALLAEVIRESEAAGNGFEAYIASLRDELATAQTRLDMAESVANLCSATKVRKPRADKGRKRKAAESPADPA